MNNALAVSGIVLKELYRLGRAPNKVELAMREQQALQERRRQEAVRAISAGRR